MNASTRPVIDGAAERARPSSGWTIVAPQGGTADEVSSDLEDRAATDHPQPGQHPQQRRTLPVRVASVVVRGGAVAFAGRPGAGKSSLACALADRGHALLTDDLAAVTERLDAPPVIHPGRPAMRMWGHGARALGWPAGDRQRIRQAEDKYVYALPDRFAVEAAPLTAIYALVDHRGAGVAIERVEGLAAFELLFAGAVHQRTYAGSAEVRSWHFAEVMRIGEEVPVYAVQSSSRHGALLDLAAEVERHAGGPTADAG